MRHLVALVMLITSQVGVAEDPVITDFSISDGNANLQWKGAAPPFDVESSSDLSGWNRVMQTMDFAASVATGNDGSAFFRIAGENPVPGVFLGQLRVDEGEFGKPLARHRLKSLWDFHLPETGAPSNIPEDFFQQLTLRLIYREGAWLKTFTGTLGDLPGASITTEARKITVSWTFGDGDEQRDYVLEMVFRSYDIDVPRSPIHLSDPEYTLSCTYAVPQPEEGHDGSYNLIIVETLQDTVSLYQLGDQETPDWLNRDFQFVVGGTTFATQYALGVPMRQGSPTFIWKTPILDEWGTTTITGLISEPLVFSDRFTQTYQPGHHNFVETFWVEPALIPGLSAELLEELRVADIRFIIAFHPSSFPGSLSTIQLVGFDLKVRDL